MALQKGQWGALKPNPQLAASGAVTVKEPPVVAAVPGSVAVEYVRGSDMGGGVGGLLYSKRWVNGAWVRSYDLENGRGDVTTQTNEAGAVTWQASYEAFGMRTAEAGTNLDPQRGNTKDEDPTGLSNQGHRYLDLETGTWLSRDPAGFVDGPNLYCYVRQNPWTAWDPEGLAAVSTDGGVNSTLKNEPITTDNREPNFSMFGVSGECLPRLPEGTPTAEPEPIKPLSQAAKRAAMERKLSNSPPDKPVADLRGLHDQLLFEGTSNQQAALAYHLLQNYHRDSPGYGTALEVATCSANAAFLEQSIKEAGIVVLTNIAMEAGGLALQSLRVLKAGGTLAGEASIAAKTLPTQASREIIQNFGSFNEARAAAVKSAGLGDGMMPFVNEIGPLKGRVTGSMSPDGMRGWRLDWGDNGFHVNWWDRTGGAKRINWNYGANQVPSKSYGDFSDLLDHAFPKP